MFLPPVANSPVPAFSRTPEPHHTSRSRTPEALHTSQTSFGENGELLSFRARHNHSFRLQQIEVEDRATKLLQKNAELEEELAAYKEYMKKSVMTLTKQKLDLEMQLRAYQTSTKRKNGLPHSLSKGSPLARLKNALPGIADSPEDSDKSNFENSGKPDSDDSGSGSDFEEGEKHK